MNIVPKSEKGRTIAYVYLKLFQPVKCLAGSDEPLTCIALFDKLYKALCKGLSISLIGGVRRFTALKKGIGLQPKYASAVRSVHTVKKGFEKDPDFLLGISRFSVMFKFSQIRFRNLDFIYKSVDYYASIIFRSFWMSGFFLRAYHLAGWYLKFGTLRNLCERRLPQWQMVP